MSEHKLLFEMERDEKRSSGGQTIYSDDEQFGHSKIRFSRDSHVGQMNVGALGSVRKMVS